ncbi:MAG: hypothetical protein N2378_05335 [Chloroflexaceae bacterium]|nr:hypothetical protein [Chloroflexaceae bacterium]
MRCDLQRQRPRIARTADHRSSKAQQVLQGLLVGPGSDRVLLHLPLEHRILECRADKLAYWQ